MAHLDEPEALNVLCCCRVVCSCCVGVLNGKFRAELLEEVGRQARERYERQ